MPEINALAKAQLGRIKALCSQVGLKYLDLPDHIVGAGIGVAFGETDYVVVSVMGGGGEGKIMITSGVLHDIRRERLEVLDACNTMTRSNTIFPVFLHDAEARWDVLMQLTYPIDLLLDNPEFFDMIVRLVPEVAATHRDEFAEKHDVGGRPWRWDGDDLGALLFVSLL